MERAEDIYSFSHLTIQKHLTAHYLSQDPSFIHKLISEHLIDQRWREIFILIAGSVHSADNLLQAISDQAQTYIKTSRLKALLQ